jgi:hypothetical protein
MWCIFRRQVAPLDYVGWSVRPLVGCSICPHDEITWKTGYVAIASRRGERSGNQLMLKTGYVEIASRLITVARSCFMGNPKKNKKK